MDLITTHVNADFDCLGAMVAARRLYPQALLVFPGAQEKGVSAYLAQHDDCAALFSKIREVDLAAIDRLILVDVSQLERIGPFAEVARRRGVELHIFDHHPGKETELSPVLARIAPVGATVTIFSELFQEQGIVPTPGEATAMMLGLYEDTGSLQFTSTTERDYLAAAFLLRHGAELGIVAENLVQEMTADQVELLHALIQSRQVLNINGIDVSIAHASSPDFVGDVATLAHKIKDMESLDAIILVIRMGDRLILVGRSRRSEVPMNDILAEFGGGGHAQAASATVRNFTLIQVLEMLPMILSRHVTPLWRAEDLMSVPVKTVESGTTIQAARDFLTRYNVNAAPVLAEGAVVGVLTRQTVDKAAQHGLEKTAIDEFMNRDFFAVAPQTPVVELKELMTRRDQRFVPVVESGRLVGAITRTDLLRHLVSGQRALPVQGAAVHGGALFKRRPIERLLRDRLPSKIIELLEAVAAVADRLSVAVYLVGGFVRDLLLRKKNFDLDLVVEGEGIVFAEALAAALAARVRTHAKFGTAVVICPDHFKIDVASARMEYYLQPGALPSVEEASLKLDLYRRDFTINTLAIALNQGRFGELYDFFGGQLDLENRVIRILHNLSFIEDPTRVFRAIRFAQRLGFHIGPHTESLLRSAVRLGFVARISGVRLRNELITILQEEEPLPILRQLANYGLLPYVQKDLVLSEKIAKLFVAAEQTLNWFQLLYTGEKIEAWQLYFLCLTSHLDDAAMEEMTTRLQMPESQRHDLLAGRAEAHGLLARLTRKKKRSPVPRASEIYHWFSTCSTTVLLYLSARADDEIRRWISQYLIHLRTVHPELSGDDLHKLGFAPGPIYREILDALRFARLDAEVESRSDEISFVKKRFTSVL
ncbi:MAG: polya polymerase [Deltaproteobacteria bacterium HGW-Deltaproteobacteria-4]|nr:MAG: polya polymerase [Deltaproteobacteria bacterium HGW-Deltaproteobacteria-4]